MNNLPNEVLVNIFSFLYEIDLYSCSLVCKKWYHVFLDGIIWEQLSFDFYRCKDRKYRIIPPNYFKATPNVWKILFKEFSYLGDPRKQIIVIENSIDASSTDEESQTVAETLLDSVSFWSSGGSDESSANEWISYKLIQPICIVNSIDISVFSAYYQLGEPTYAPQRIQIYVGYSIDTENWEGYEYVSDEIEIKNISDTQHISLTPHLAMGGYIVIRLLGKCSRQPGDEKFYTVIRNVKIWGIPVGILSSNLIDTLLQNACICNNFLEDIKKRYTPINPNQSSAIYQEFANNLKNCSDKNSLQIILQKYFKDVLIYEMKLIIGDFNSIKEKIFECIENYVKSESWGDLVKYVLKIDPILGISKKQILDKLFLLEGNKVVNQYLAQLLSFGVKLSEDESIALLKLAKEDEEVIPLVNLAIRIRNFCCTQSVGDFAKDLDDNISLSIFIQGNCFDRLVHLTAEKGMFDIVLALWRDNEGCSVQYKKTLEIIKQYHETITLYEFAKLLLEQDPHNAPEIINKVLEINSENTNPQIILNYLKDKIQFMITEIQ